MDLPAPYKTSPAKDTTLAVSKLAWFCLNAFALRVRIKGVTLESSKQQLCRCSALAVDLRANQ